MPKSPPFVAFYTDLWRGGIMEMSDQEELVLFKICQKIWSTGKPVHEDDVERFYRRPCEGIAGALQTLIRFGKLTRSDAGYLMSAKALDEHKAAQGRMLNAKAAAATRWKDKGKRRDASAVRQQSRSKAAAKPEQSRSSAIRSDIYTPPTPLKAKPVHERAGQEARARSRPEIEHDIARLQTELHVLRGAAADNAPHIEKKVAEIAELEGQL